MAHLKLALFGGFEAMLPSGAVRLPTKKAQALLAYCALTPGHAHQREKLAAMFWGDVREENARNSLRQTLFVLRTAFHGISPSVMRVGGDTIAVDPGAVEVDVLRFEALVTERAPITLEQSAALYRGDLLEGFIIDEEPWEEWLLQERERLRDLALEGLARLLRHQCEMNAVDAAVRTARRLLVLEPLQEGVHRALMRLQARAGRREAAIRQYEVCVGLLRRELQLEPEPETRQLYEQILHEERLAPVAAAVANPELSARALEHGSEGHVDDNGAVLSSEGSPSDLGGFSNGGGQTHAARLHYARHMLQACVALRRTTGRISSSLERIKEARKLLSQGFEREREGFERGGQLWAKSIADASDGG